MSFDMAGLNIFDLEIQRVPRDLAFASAETKQKQVVLAGLSVWPQRSASAFVGVADPNDIILAEIGSHLYLDDNDRIIGVVAKRVMGAERDVDRMAGQSR